MHICLVSFVLFCFNTMFERRFPLDDVRHPLTPNLISYFERKLQELYSVREDLRDKQGMRHNEDLLSYANKLENDLRNEMRSTYDIYCLKYAIPSESDPVLKISNELRAFMTNMQKYLSREEILEKGTFKQRTWYEKTLEREKLWDNYVKIRDDAMLRSFALASAKHPRSESLFKQLSNDNIALINRFASSEAGDKLRSISLAYMPG